MLFWQGEGNWRGYKATTVLLTSGLAKTFLDNYWIFTPVPLTEGNDSPAGKFFYFIAQLAFNELLYGSVGLSLDYLRSLYHETFSSTSPNYRAF